MRTSYDEKRGEIEIGGNLQFLIILVVLLAWAVLSPATCVCGG